MKNLLPNFRKTIFMVLLMLWTFIGYGIPTQYFVDANAGLDEYDGKTITSAFATIEHAVAVAATGDIIIVAEGVYNVFEPIYIDSKTITLQSKSGQLNTTIISYSTSGLFNISGQAMVNSSIIQGFRIEMISGGTAFTINDASKPTIVGNFINYGDYGIYCSGMGAPMLMRNYFISQYIAISLNNFSSPVQIANNTFYNCDTAIYSEAISGNIQIFNNIFETARKAVQLDSRVTASISYNCFYGIDSVQNYFSSSNNIEAFPNFEYYNFSISETSPCKDKGQGFDPAPYNTSPADIGASFFIPAPVTGIKVTKISDMVFRFHSIQKGEILYSWIIDNGQAIDNAFDSLTYTFTTVGIHKVEMQSTSVTGAKSGWLTTEVYVKGLCRAGFTVSNINQNTRVVTITNKATNFDKLTWNFNPYWDADTIDNRASFTHYYSEPGIYQATQYIEDSKTGCADTVIVPILLRDTSCQHWFNTTVLPNKTSEFEAFYYSPLDTVKSWEWNFGDGTTGTGQLVKHTYAKVGYYTVTLKAKGSFCASTFTNWGYAEGLACDTPFFSKSKKDSTYTFTIKQPKAGVTYEWYLGDWANNVNGTSVSHKYTDEGIFWPYVYAYDTINECTSYQYDSVRIGNAGCYAYFSYENDTLNHIRFYNYSSTDVKYFWEFGDGTTSRLFEPSHTYKDAGYYKVTLTVRDSVNNCTKQESYDIVAGRVNCKADFSYSIDAATRNVTFKNLSTGQPTGYYWYFDDWDYGYEENPIHKFANNGIFNVYLAVYNDISGCVDEIYKEVKIGNASAFTYAGFSYYIGSDNKTVYFTNESSESITKNYWTFGDGSYKEESSPTKVYDKPGLYKVCLKVFNKTTGENDEKCEEILVGISDCNLKAEFSYMIDNKTNTMKLANKSTGSIDAFYWDFGDGITSDEKIPSHKYAEPGFYLVTLSARKWNSDCADFYAEFIQVGEVNCRAEFDYTVNTTDNSLTLKDQSKGAIADYFWYFDDGDYITEKNPVKKFETAGIHYVSLSITDSSGLCSDYMEKTIQVGDVSCSAHFSYYIDIKTRKAFCKNEAIGKSTQFFWSFSDGSESLDANPTHQFEYPGYYTIGLNTFNSADWCMDYFEQVVLIGEQGADCEADFFFSAKDATREVKFNDNSKGTISKYIWNFGDNRDTIKVTTDKNPTHKYQAGGYYDVCLTVINDKNVSNITCKLVKVDVTDATDCAAKFVYTVDTAKKSVSFVNKSIGKATKLIWNYGDQKTDTITKDTIRHKYSKADYYLVSLHTETAKGCRSASYQLINVSKPYDGLKVNFGYEANSYNKKAGGYPVDLVGAGLGDQSKLRWSFGDGSGDSTSNSPTHVYSKPGNYTVCLTYADPVTKQEAVHCDTIYTTTLCEADQEKPKAIGKKLITVKLDANGSVSVAPNQIDSASTDDCGIKIYSISKGTFGVANIGSNKVYLTITDWNGNKDSSQVNVVVEAYSGISSNQIASMEVYPNPFNNQFKITYYLVESAIVDISLTDMMGKRITSIKSGIQYSGNQNVIFDAANLESGSYILQVQTSKGFVKKQVVVKR